jgi:hypothetical protein
MFWPKLRLHTRTKMTSSSVLSTQNGTKYAFGTELRKFDFHCISSEVRSIYLFTYPAIYLWQHTTTSGTLAPDNRNKTRVLQPKITPFSYYAEHCWPNNECVYTVDFIVPWRMKTPFNSHTINFQNVVNETRAESAGNGELHLVL